MDLLAKGSYPVIWLQKVALGQNFWSSFGSFDSQAGDVQAQPASGQGLSFCVVMSADSRIEIHPQALQTYQSLGYLYCQLSELFSSILFALQCSIPSNFLSFKWALVHFASFKLSKNSDLNKRPQR